MSEEEPRLEAASDGYQVYYRGKRLYAPGNPRGGATRRATAVDIPPQTLVLVPSPLLGYGLEELLSACPQSCVVLAVELDPNLARLTAESSAAGPGGDRRLHWALAPGGRELEAILGRLMRARPRRVKTVALSGGFGMNAAAYRDLAEQLEVEIRIFWQNAMTRVRMGRLWIRNLLRNLPFVQTAKPLAELEDERPLLVVGAGPSLDDHIHEVPPDDSEARGRLRVLAADTALAPLAAHGVTPDIVLAVESQQANAGDFLLPAASSAQSRRRPHLICDLTTYPSVRRVAATGGVSFVSSRFAPTVMLDRLASAGLLPETVPPLGSVGVLAVHLARRLTTGPVVFVGLDFAYDLERTHARGAPMHTLALARRRRLDPSPFFGLALARPLLTLTDTSGAEVRSDAVLLSYAEQLRSLVSRSTAVYDLAPEAGLPNGAAPGGEVMAAAAGGRDLTSQAASPAASGIAANAIAASAVSPQQAAEALRGERHRLDDLTAALRGALSRAGSAATVSSRDSGEIAPLLETCDYVHLDFPDEPTDSRVFLGRALLSALDYAGRIDRVLRGIRRRGDG